MPFHQVPTPQHLLIVGLGLVELWLLRGRGWAEVPRGHGVRGGAQKPKDLLVWGKMAFLPSHAHLAHSTHSACLSPQYSQLHPLSLIIALVFLLDLGLQPQSTWLLGLWEEDGHLGLLQGLLGVVVLTLTAWHGLELPGLNLKLASCSLLIPFLTLDLSTCYLYCRIPPGSYGARDCLKKVGLD